MYAYCLKTYLTYQTCRFQMYSKEFVRATKFNVRIPPTLCEKYKSIFYGCSSDNFQAKNFDCFDLISVQNKDCGYLLEPPHWGRPSEYPKSMFQSRNKKPSAYPYPYSPCGPNNW